MVMILLVAVVAILIAFVLLLSGALRSSAPHRFHDPSIARMARVARAVGAVMATEIPGLLHSYIAGANLSASQFLFLTTDANGNVVVNTTAGAQVIGVLQDKPVQGDPACVMVNGVSKVIAGAAIPFIAGGTPVQSDNQGRAVPATTGNEIIGWIRNWNAAAAGEVCSVEIIRGGKA
jgi:hypothetical protein